MSKAIARMSALVLALTAFAAPVGRMHAQPITPTPQAVTGGDPQPTGEDDADPSWIVVISMLSSAVA